MKNKVQKNAISLATVTIGETVLFVKTGSVLSEAISGERPCGGHGKCGKCKVRVLGSVSGITETELKLLSRDEIANGVRLACLTAVEGDCTVTPLKDEKAAEILTEGSLPPFEPKPLFSSLGVAIDIGTTTLAARLYDKDACLLAESSRLNPQSEFGADVISRIEKALGGKTDELARSVRGAIDGMILELSELGGVSPELIDGIVITGNTVMLSLLTKESTEPLSHAPFEAKRLFGEMLNAEDIGLNSLKKNTKVYIPHCIHAFVGADTTCAIIANRLTESKDTVMLADVGTNGEMALWHNSHVTACSTAAGPAFEGVGISMGMRASVGAIDRVKVEDGVLKAHVIGNTSPVGICGSALVDTVACMLDCDVIDESGYLEEDEFTVSPPVTLTQRDLRMLQLAKSAICAGLLTILSHASVSENDVKKLFIAGGFGNYLSLKNATRIGLIPKRLGGVSNAVGNSALVGASMILLNTDFTEECNFIASNSTVLDLSSDKTFSDLYISGMELCETEQ